MRVSFKRLHLFLPALILLAGCNDTLSVSEELANAREKWAEAGPDSYAYDLRQTCFCPSYGWVRLEVRNSVVISARVVDTGEQLDPANWPSVEQLFTRIEQADENDDVIKEIELRFDVRYGYPTFAEFTSKPEIADGNSLFEARALGLPTAR